MRCVLVDAQNRAYRETLDRECPGWGELRMVPDRAISRAARAFERAGEPYREDGMLECSCGAHGWNEEA